MTLRTYYRLSEASKATNAIVVDAINAINGYYSGTCADRTSVVPSSTDHALSLSGAGWAIIASAPDFSTYITTGKQSWDFWYTESAPPAAGTTWSLIAKGDNARWQYAVQRTPTGLNVPFWQPDGTAVTAATATLTLSPNVSHHIALVYDNTATNKVSLYVDGALVAYSTALATGAVDNGAPFTIGNRNSGDQPAGASGSPVGIDEVAVRDTALAAADVQSVYTSGIGDPFIVQQSQIPGRSIHYRLGDASKANGAVAADLMGNVNGAYTGTVSDVAALVSSASDHAMQVAGAGRVVSPNNALFSPHVSGGKGSWGFWFTEQAPPTATESLIALGDANNWNYAVQRDANNLSVTFWALDGTPIASCGGAVTLTPNAVHYVEVVYDNTATNKVVLYVDGAQFSATTVISATPVAGTAPFNIGNRNYGDQPAGSATHPVSFDEVVVRSTAITAADVLNIWNSGQSTIPVSGSDTGRANSAESQVLFAVTPTSDTAPILSIETYKLTVGKGSADSSPILSSDVAALFAAVVNGQTNALLSADQALLTQMFQASEFTLMTVLESPATQPVQVAFDTGRVIGTESQIVGTSLSVTTSDTGPMLSVEGATTAILAAPAISATVASRLSDTSMLITWTTDRPATSQVEYGTTTVYGNLTPLDSNLVTAHSVTLAELLPSTTYHYRVRSDG